MLKALGGEPQRTEQLQRAQRPRGGVHSSPLARLPLPPPPFPAAPASTEKTRKRASNGAAFTAPQTDQLSCRCPIPRSLPWTAAEPAYPHRGFSLPITPINTQTHSRNPTLGKPSCEPTPLSVPCQHLLALAKPALFCHAPPPQPSPGHLACISTAYSCQGHRCAPRCCVQVYFLVPASRSPQA